MEQKENIDLLIRRVLALGLFLFVFILFKSTDCSSIETSDKSSIEKAIETEYSATIVVPLSIPGFDNSLVSTDSFKLCECNNENNRIVCSNNKLNHLLLLSKKRYNDIKPHIFILKSHQVRASLAEEIPLIS